MTTTYSNSEPKRDEKGRFLYGSRELTFKHGQSARNRTAEYNCWDAIKQRCLNPKNDNYKNYGGRGITICERWLSFENFFTDMGPRPAGMTIERRDNNKGYGPENCYWADRGTQARNTRRNRWIEYNGQQKVVADWADEYGIPRAALLMRLRNGWSVKRALTQPVRKTSKSGRKHARIQ